MASGFIGNRSQQFFSRVRETSQQASGMIASAGGQSSPNTAGLGEGQGYRLGMGSSQNVVMREEVYRSCTSQLGQLDNRMAEQIENVCKQIDDLCQSIFIIPETTPRIQEVVQKVRGSLSDFQDVTTKVCRTSDMYVSQIRALDR